MMNNEKRDFDKEAASWDENPARVRLANDVAQAISGRIPLAPDMHVLEFGCGTGLLTFRLQPRVRSITGIDSSQGMLDIFNRKIAKLNLTNVRSQLLDLERGDTLTGKYHLVVSSMTLHHVRETALLFDQFLHILAPGGCLCIADLDLDGGRFHNDNTGVFHPGFDRAMLRRTFTDAGLENIQDMTAAEVLKPDSEGEMMRFTVFLMTGRKRSDKA